MNLPAPMEGVHVLKPFSLKRGLSTPSRNQQYLTAEEKVDPPPTKKAKREHLEEHLASCTAEELVVALRKKGRMSGDLFVSADEAKILSPTKEDKASAAEQAAVHTANLRRVHMQVHSARDLD